MRPAPLLATALLLAPLAAGAHVGGEPLAPAFFSGWDRDGVEPPFDRCPDRGKPGKVDAVGCPIREEHPLGDLDGDGLLNGETVLVEPRTPLAHALAKRDIVYGATRDGRLVFFGEASEGTDPRDANTDRHDILGDGYEVALRHGLLPAARQAAYGERVVQPDGVPLADPLVPDDYLEVHPALVGSKLYWNEALEAALRQVVADDLAPEANATYAPPAVRLHAWVSDAIGLPDGHLTPQEVLGNAKVPAQVAQHVEKSREPFVTYVVVAPSVSWDGGESAGLAFGQWVLVAVDHKGFDACEAEGGAPGTPACDRLMDLFRWTLNHERMHRWGLPDTVGGKDLMSTSTDVRTPKPHESAARFAYLERHPDALVRYER